MVSSSLRVWLSSEALLVLGLERHLRQKLAHDLLDGVERCLLLIDGGEDDGVLAVAERHRRIEIAGEKMPDRGRGDEIARRMADDLLVSGAARLQIGLGRSQGGQRLGAAGLGLGHVGARDLADIEAVLGRLELLGQHRHVVLAQFHDGRVAYDIDVSGGGVEQHGLLDGAQALARRLHRRFRLADGVQVLEAFEQRLRQLHRVTVRVGYAVAGGAAR